MIIRILNEGQWDVAGDHLSGLNTLDDAVEKAVASGDQDQLTTALHSLLEKVRTSGTVVPDEALEDSDLILPAADSTLDEVRALLNESDEGLIPS